MNKLSIHDGKYKQLLPEAIGRGSFGSVYLFEEIETNTKYSILNDFNIII